jgi:Xaa-Pro aminopeptidase
LSEIAFGVDTSELKARRERAVQTFSDGVLLIHAKSAFETTVDGFRQDAIFYYFTSLENTAGAILLIDGRSRETWLFLPSQPLLAKLFPAEGSFGSDAVKRSGIEHVVDWSEFEKVLAGIATKKVPAYYIGLTFAQPELPPNFAKNISRAPSWIVAIGQKWPSLQIKEAGSAVLQLLDAQSSSEMVTVRAAAMASVSAVLAGMRAIRPGVSQRAVELAVVGACWKAGAHGIAFWPWAMAGPNAVFPKPFVSLTRYDYLDRVIKTGDLVRLDIGCESDHYRGDLGRTVPASGRYTDEQRELWNVFVSAYLAATKTLRAGIAVDEVFATWRAELLRHRQTAKTPLAKEAINEWSERQRVPYWQFHTMNLTDRAIRDSLPLGATVAFEPIATIGDYGLYLEDLFLITKTGAELLTPGVPYTAEQIEAAMR